MMGLKVRRHKNKGINNSNTHGHIQTKCQWMDQIGSDRLLVAIKYNSFGLFFFFFFIFFENGIFFLNFKLKWYDIWVVVVVMVKFTGCAFSYIFILINHRYTRLQVYNLFEWIKLNPHQTVFFFTSFDFYLISVRRDGKFIGFLFLLFSIENCDWSNWYHLYICTTDQHRVSRR